MSDDIGDKIDDLDDLEDLDDETRQKLQKVLDEEEADGADTEGSESEEADDPNETRVEANPMGAQVDSEAEGEDDASGEEAEAEAGDATEEAVAQGEDDEQSADAADDADGEDDEQSADAGDEEDDANSFKSVPKDTGASDWILKEPDDAIGGVFRPQDSEDDGGEMDSAYLGAEDVEGYEREETNPMTFVLGGFVVLLVTGFAFMGLNYTEQGERLRHLFQGDLRAYEQAKARQTEETFRQKQLENMPKYGTLTLDGRPKYANIFLDGNLQYGKIEKTGEWRPVLLTPPTQFQNLNVAEDHDVEVRAPNHETKDWTLTEDMWTSVGKQSMNFERNLTINLMPESSTKQIEFQQRQEKDPEEDYFGEITVDSDPEGAKIIFDGKPLLDEDGEQVTTPATFEKVYTKKEDSDELEEEKIKVDMPPDRGHKIQLRVTDEELDAEDFGGGDDGGGDEMAKAEVEDNDDSGGLTEIKEYGPDEYPKFVTPLQRQMWTCEWKDGEEPEEPPYPKHCNYSFELNVDFNKLKDFIRNKKKQREEVKERNKQLEEKIEKLQERLAAQ